MNNVSDLLLVIIPALIGSGSALLTKKLDKKYYPDNVEVLNRSRTLITVSLVYFDDNRREHIQLPGKLNTKEMTKDDLLKRIDIECDLTMMQIKNRKLRNGIINYKKHKTEFNLNKLINLFGKYYGI